MKICRKCKIPKEWDLFGNNKNELDKKQKTCKKCMAEDQNKSYLKHKERYNKRENQYKLQKLYLINKIKTEKGCEKCNDKRYYVLDFHHIIPEKKEFNIGSIVKHRGLNITLKEIEKCMLLCSNCHREFHYLEKQTKLTIKDYIYGP